MKQVRPKKNLGQHFLTDLSIAKAIADTVDACPELPVLEVGPGIGTLTCALLQFAGHVTAVEMDHDLPAVLEDTLASWWDRFTLLQMDATVCADG